jgi:hypothetical protein
MAREMLDLTSGRTLLIVPSYEAYNALTRTLVGKSVFGGHSHDSWSCNYLRIRL